MSVHAQRRWLVVLLGLVAAILTGTSFAMALNARDHRVPAAAATAVTSAAAGPVATAPPSPNRVSTAATGPALHTSTPSPHPAPAPVTTPPALAPSATPTPTQTAVPMPQQCRDWGCTRRQSIDLHDGYSVAVWLTPAAQDGQQENLDSRPYLELLHGTAAVQWLISPVEGGYGWSGTLSCNADGPVPNCALVGALGAHSSFGVVFVLDSGKLVAPAGGPVVADSAGAMAADLDGDGYLDIIASMSDYTPDYADGTNFWDTFRFTSSGLVSTGCEKMSSPAAAAPTQLLTGSCPAR